MARLVQGLGRDFGVGVVLDDDAGCAVQVRVDVEVVLLEVAPDQQLVLLPVAAGNDEVVFGADEPEKLFKPVRLARFADVDGNLRWGRGPGGLPPWCPLASLPCRPYVGSSLVCP